MGSACFSEKSIDVVDTAFSIGPEIKKRTRRLYSTDSFIVKTRTLMKEERKEEGDFPKGDVPHVSIEGTFRHEKHDPIINFHYFEKQQIIVTLSMRELRFWDVRKNKFLEKIRVRIISRDIHRQGFLNDSETLFIRSSIKWDENCILVSFVDGYFASFEVNTFEKVNEFKFHREVPLFKKILRIPSVEIGNGIHCGLFLGICVDKGFYLISYFQRNVHSKIKPISKIDFRCGICLSEKFTNCLYAICCEDENETQRTARRINFVTGETEIRLKRKYRPYEISLSCFMNDNFDEFLMISNYNTRSVSIVDGRTGERILFLRPNEPQISSSFTFQSMYIFMGEPRGVLEWFDLRKIVWEMKKYNGGGVSGMRKRRKRFLTNLGFLEEMEKRRKLGLHRKISLKSQRSSRDHGFKDLMIGYNLEEEKKKYKSVNLIKLFDFRVDSDWLRLFVGTKYSVKIVRMDNVDTFERKETLQRMDLKERKEFLVSFEYDDMFFGFRTDIKYFSNSISNIPIIFLLL